jgi:hypothetical protein
MQLPGDVITHEYAKEYGTDKLQLPVRFYTDLVRAPICKHSYLLGYRQVF